MQNYFNTVSFFIGIWRWTSWYRRRIHWIWSLDYVDEILESSKKWQCKAYV
jgi:hypothetical protein